MRFAYERYPVRGIGTTRYVIVHRPMVPLRILGRLGSENLLGLADTGADDTLLPDYLIKPLGIVIAPGDQAVIVGIEGGTVVVRYGFVDLELRGPSGSCRWAARVGFHPSFKTILGHAGFLDHFNTTFNGHRRLLTLTPNITLPATNRMTP